jgi:hypothetical protein
MSWVLKRRPEPAAFPNKCYCEIFLYLIIYSRDID